MCLSSLSVFNLVWLNEGVHVCLFTCAISFIEIRCMKCMKCMKLESVEKISK